MSSTQQPNGLHTPAQDMAQLQGVLATVQTEVAEVKKFTVEVRTMITIAKFAAPMIVSAFVGVIAQFYAMNGNVSAQQEQIAATQEALSDHVHDPAQEQLQNVVNDLRAEVAALNESVDILKRVSLDLERDRDR